MPNRTGQSIRQKFLTTKKLSLIHSIYLTGQLVKTLPIERRNPVRKTFLLTFTSLVSLSLVISACGDGVDTASDDSELLRIIDDNDLKPIDGSYAHQNIIKAIGRMELGCTVTHVGNGLAITAGHCLSQSPYYGVKNNYSCNSAGFSIRWGLTYNSNGYMTSRCVQVVVSEYNSERDYALLKVSPIPHGQATLSRQKAAMGQEISIFSHPRKRPLEWSGWCRVESLFDKARGHQFGYTCDTEGGSSGAAVLNRKMEVVGIHNYYSGDANLNGATFITSTPVLSVVQNGASAF